MQCRVLILGKKYFTCSRVINATAAALWMVGFQFVWDPTTHSAAATAFLTILHVEYCSPNFTTSIMLKIEMVHPHRHD